MFHKSTPCRIQESWHVLAAPFTCQGVFHTVVNQRARSCYLGSWTHHFKAHPKAKSSLRVSTSQQLLEFLFVCLILHKLYLWVLYILFAQESWLMELKLPFLHLYHPSDTQREYNYRLQSASHGVYAKRNEYVTLLHVTIWFLLGS